MDLGLDLGNVFVVFSTSISESTDLDLDPFDGDVVGDVGHRWHHEMASLAIFVDSIYLGIVGHSWVKHGKVDK